MVCSKYPPNCSCRQLSYLIRPSVCLMDKGPKGSNPRISKGPRLGCYAMGSTSPFHSLLDLFFFKLSISLSHHLHQPSSFLLYARFILRLSPIVRLSWLLLSKYYCFQRFFRFKFRAARYYSPLFFMSTFRNPIASCYRLFARSMSLTRTTLS